MLYINKLTDKQFYNVLGGYAKGVRLRKLLKRYHYTPNMFIKDTLRGNKIRARPLFYGQQTLSTPGRAIQKRL